MNNVLITDNLIVSGNITPVAYLVDRQESAQSTQISIYLCTLLFEGLNFYTLGLRTSR
jgi:hypothetical protein